MTSKVFGYCRHSTVDQSMSLETQSKAIAEFVNGNLQGYELETLCEAISALNQPWRQRKELSRAIDGLRRGDVFVASHLDRVARRMEEVNEIVAAIEAKGATFALLSPRLDSSTPEGKLMLSMLGYVAEAEARILKERQRSGMDAAIASGRLRGRHAALKGERLDRLRADFASGVPKRRLAREYGVALSTVYKALSPEYPS